MEFISRTSTGTDQEQILHELCKDVEGEFDLGVLFVAPNQQTLMADLVRDLKETLKLKNLLGCTCAGIIGTDAEIERQTAATLTLLRLPGVKVTPFTLNQAQLEGLKTKDEWYSFFEIFPNENPTFLALPDPFLFDINRFLSGLNQAYSGCPVMGGLASSASGPGENTLVINSETRDDGVVGVALTGNLHIETIVSQGCKPIGHTYIVTKAEDNFIHTLAGKPFLEVLQDALKKLPSSDQLLAQEAIFVGIAMDEYKDEFKRGDFLIRGLMGIDPQTNAGVIADFVKTGQTVQFHLRDAKTATEDLRELLAWKQKQNPNQRPKGALVFCCNGRGEYLFRQKNHDIKLIQQHLGPIPAGGFFCAGEIGPVGGHNFLHGFTNSIALFYPLKMNT